MWFAPNKASMFLAQFVCVGSTLCAQLPKPVNAAGCKLVVNRFDFESRTDGPFVKDIGYSNALKTCVVIRTQGFPTKGNQVYVRTDVLDVEALHTIWTNGRVVHQGHFNEKYPALSQELKKLDIELAVH